MVTFCRSRANPFSGVLPLESVQCLGHEAGVSGFTVQGFQFATLRFCFTVPIYRAGGNHMSYSLNSLQAGYAGDYIRDYYRGDLGG